MVGLSGDLGDLVPKHVVFMDFKERFVHVQTLTQKLRHSTARTEGIEKNFVKICQPVVSKVYDYTHKDDVKTISLQESNKGKSNFNK